MKRLSITILILLATPALFAAGTLTAVTSASAPIQIKSHTVNVIIDNGVARTEVVQTFFNPNDNDVEAVYGFPVPESASLAEITIWNNGRTLNGEVIEADEAKKVYAEERT
ncbi:MAG: VIT domain-containing protein, partial [Thermoanaerobaculia bacterium]